MGAKLIWITGLSASGKTTLANAIHAAMQDRGELSIILDGDVLRKGLNADLGFSEEDRRENLRRAAHVANLFLDQGYTVIGAFISPKAEDRNQIREVVGREKYVEVFLDVSLELCIDRDPKGLYKKAISREIESFTGISQPYEKPEAPNFIFKEAFDVHKAVEQIYDSVFKTNS